jgi:hypothetical protein
MLRKFRFHSHQASFSALCSLQMQTLAAVGLHSLAAFEEQNLMVLVEQTGFDELKLAVLDV